MDLDSTWKGDYLRTPSADISIDRILPYSKVKLGISLLNTIFYFYIFPLDGE